MTTVKADCGCCQREFDREFQHELCQDCRKAGCKFKFNNGYGGKWVHVSGVPNAEKPKCPHASGVMKDGPNANTCPDCGEGIR